MHGGLQDAAHASTSTTSSPPTSSSTARTMLQGMDAILVPGGFGERGIEGKIQAVRYRARARHSLSRHLPRHADGHRRIRSPRAGLHRCQQHRVQPRDAASRDCADLRVAGSGARFAACATRSPTRARTMRLGAQEVVLGAGTRAREIFGKDVILERHRHRYEFNNTYLDRFTHAGLRFSGFSRDGLVEVIELQNHPWFVATQFHPEFTSTPRDGHPLFTGFIRAARAHRAAHCCRQRRAHEARMNCQSEVGHRPTFLPHRRPLRHREPNADAGNRWPSQRDHDPPRHPVHFQSLVRQGEPLVARELPRPRHRRGPEGPRERPPRDRRARANRRARRHAPRGSGVGC